MKTSSLAFLKKMLETPSPSGFETPAQEVWSAYLKPHTDRIDKDVYGNRLAVLNPKGFPRLMLAGHMDEVGLMVTHVSDQGYLHFAGIGGVETAVLLAQRVHVHTARGPLLGVIGRKPIHLVRDEKEFPKMKELWIDVGAKDGKEAKKLVAIGDPVTLAVGCQELKNNLLVSRGLDDKVGAFVAAETMRLLATGGRKLRASVCAVSTVQEELGSLGAAISGFALDPQVAVAIDVTHASDYPGIAKEQTGDISLGKGPVIDRGSSVNRVVERRLREAAKKARLSFQESAAPRGTGTDADDISRVRGGVATGLVSIPNRYMHTAVEVVHTGDLEKAAQLLAEFALRLDRAADFRY